MNLMKKLSCNMFQHFLAVASAMFCSFPSWLCLREFNVSTGSSLYYTFSCNFLHSMPMHDKRKIQTVFFLNIFYSGIY
jgi:hypothetical protein